MDSWLSFGGFKSTTKVGKGQADVGRIVAQGSGYSWNSLGKCYAFFTLGQKCNRI